MGVRDPEPRTECARDVVSCAVFMNSIPGFGIADLRFRIADSKKRFCKHEPRLSFIFYLTPCRKAQAESEFNFFFLFIFYFFKIYKKQEPLENSRLTPIDEKLVLVSNFGYLR